MFTWKRRMFISVIATMLVLSGLVSAITTASNAALPSISDQTGTISIEAFICPRGMAEDALDPNQCEPSEIPNIRVVYGEPERTNLGPSHATFDGSTYVWDGLPLLDEGSTEFMVVLNDAPLGSHGGIFVIDGVPVGNGFTIANLTPTEPSVEIELYYLFPEVPTQSPMIATLACPFADADIVDCEPIEGVIVSVEADGVPVAGGIFTSRFVFDLGLSVAMIDSVPLDSMLTITEIGGLPEGYVPAPGYDPMTIATVDLVRGSGGGGDAYGYYAFIIYIPVEGTTVSDDEPLVEPSGSGSQMLGRPASIQAGTCENPIPDATIVLLALAKGVGKSAGAGDAVAGARSLSTVNMSIDDLLAPPHVIVVRADVTKPNSILACGEIGGIRQPDGSIVIGLREMRGSSYSGIAYLSVDPENATLSKVWVFIAKSLSEEDRGTPVPVAN